MKKIVQKFPEQALLELEPELEGIEEDDCYRTALVLPAGANLRFGHDALGRRCELTCWVWMKKSFSLSIPMELMVRVINEETFTTVSPQDNGG